MSGTSGDKQSGRRAAVLGHPIAHSLSPVLHRAAYQALGLTDWSYDAYDVAEDELPEFLATTSDWAGLSLTMPLKQAVIPLLDHVEPLAALTGSVNTVLISGGSSGIVRVGANTDIYGIAESIRKNRAGSPNFAGELRAAVIGAGATAASALAALGELGCSQPTVYLRSRGRAGQLMRAAERMGLSVSWEPYDSAVDSPQFDVVISTVPAGASDSIANGLRADSGDGLLLDVLYSPWPTRLAAAWPGPVVSGHAMLLYQAAEQVRLMTGRVAPIEVMAAAMAEATIVSQKQEFG